MTIQSSCNTKTTKTCLPQRQVRRFGSLIRKLRENAGLTPENLAAAIGVSDKRVVSNWELGSRLSEAAMFASKLANALQQPVALLVDAYIEDSGPRPTRFGNVIFRARIIQGVTQEHLAAAVGVNDKSIVSDWELGKRLPHVPFVPKLANTLKQPVDLFVDAYMEDSNPPPTQFGNVIFRARITQGLTEEDLATAIGAGLSTVNNWERGKWLPRPYRLLALSEALGLPLNKLKEAC